MRSIGCIAYGSLIWDPRTLPLAAPFAHAGPPLPVEFSRVALDGRVTLVVDPGVAPSRTWWAPLAVGTLEQGLAELARREGIATDRVDDWIGVARRSGPGPGAGAGWGSPDATIRRAIADWLDAQALEAVLWTALPARRPDGRLERPGADELVAHLEGLEGAARDRAEQDIRRAPAALRTPNRSRFEADFGWTPQDGAAGGA